MLKDFLQTCNDKGTSEDHFVKVWCVRCLQPECSRSNSGKSLFEVRTSTWKERLVTHVPRLDESDPHYGQVSSKVFVEVQGWQPLAPVAPPQPIAWVAAPSIEPEPIPESEPVLEPVPAPYRPTDKLPDQSGRILAPPERIVPSGGRIRLG